MKDLKGKTAYVSGAASGIGFGIASALAQAGARIAMVDIRAEALAEARARLHNLGDQIDTFVSDVSDPALVEATAQEIEQKFGPIHIVCNNAGVSMIGIPLDEITQSDWDWVIDVNIKGVVNGIRTFVPRLKAHGEGGHIVNTASIAGLQVNPNFRTGAYAMTKYAVVALSEALEQELAGTGIGVSVLCPAAVDTGIVLSARSRPARLGGPFVREADHFFGELLKDGFAPSRSAAASCRRSRTTNSTSSRTQVRANGWSAASGGLCRRSIAPRPSRRASASRHPWRLNVGGAPPPRN